MTNKDAIYILSGLKRSLNEYCGLNNNGQKAFDMAISALQALDVPDTNVGDMISRQVAIDAIVNWAESHHENPDGDDCIMIILDVPSAQPTQTNTLGTMDDLVSKQAAIDAVEKESQVDGAYGYMDTKSIVDLLNDLSSALEPSIPVSWIEKHVDWLKNMDNEFANLTAMNISTMVKKWKKEQEEADGSDKPTSSN